MKKVLLLVIMFFFLLCLALPKIEYLRDKNGYWWEEKSSLSQLSFIEGFICGVAVTREEIENWKDLSRKEEESKVYDDILTVLKITIDIERVTYGQFQDGITEIYKDYANKKIPVHELIPLVSRRVKGEISKEEIEFWLMKMRRDYK